MSLNEIISASNLVELSSDAMDEIGGGCRHVYTYCPCGRLVEMETTFCAQPGKTGCNPTSSYKYRSLCTHY